MFHSIYFEEEITEHPFVEKILKRYPQIPHIPCNRYTEVFNRKAQDFRFQKKAPSLILAKKWKNFVLETPSDYSIGGCHNFYFSHMLNCVFDCRYCFLQGMYRSANFVVFINTEDFKAAIAKKISDLKGETPYFFSGYDCDSLALESTTGFIEGFLPFFKSCENANFELRTKSTNIRFLLNCEPIKNCIVSYTLSPHETAYAIELKAPSTTVRIKALTALQEKGWTIGLRFDPVIFADNFESLYAALFRDVFEKIDPDKVHSTTLGPLRFPKEVFKSIVKLYPEEKLFSHSISSQEGIISYKKEIERKILEFCKLELLKYIPKKRLFSYEVSK